MPTTVSLKKIVESLDLQGDLCQGFLDPESGEVVVVTDEDRYALEVDDPDKLPLWQKEFLPKLREVVGSDRWLPLPSSAEIHEWAIMRSFCDQVDGEAAREELLGAIHGRGAFRSFKRSLDRLGLWEVWDAYRNSALEAVAREWLESHGVAYEEP